MGKIKLWKEILASRLGLQNDFVGYETLIDYLEKHQIFKLEGDLLEIGAFMGGGTKKLAQFSKQYNKKLITIDVFDPSFDKTCNERNESMESIYNAILGKRDLKTVFNNTITQETNVVVYAKDSKSVELPQGTKLCFSFIDGNHDPGYVESDFKMVWDLTVPEGVVCFHDYGGDLPLTTKAINNLVVTHKESIQSTFHFEKKCLLFIRKK